MNENDRNVMTDAIEKLGASVALINQNLAGHSLTAQSLADAMQELCPDVSGKELREACEELLNGVRFGSTYANKLMNMSREELDGVLPDYLRQTLAKMDEDHQHQYLILIYQVLRERSDQKITRNEMIQVANAANSELLDRITELLHLAQAEETYEIAHLLNNYAEKIQDSGQFQGDERYTQEEQNWILAAAMFAEAQSNQIEKVPASIIGTTMGVTSVAGQSFRDCMLSKVIPAAVATLAVVATCALAFLCIKAIVTHSLFAAVLTWMKAHYTVSFLRTITIVGIVTAAEPVKNTLQTIWDTTFSKMAALTCKNIMVGAQQPYVQIASGNSELLSTGTSMLTETESVLIAEDLDDEHRSWEIQDEEEV